MFVILSPPYIPEVRTICSHQNPFFHHHPPMQHFVKSSLDSINIGVKKNHISYVIERGTLFVLTLSNYKISHICAQYNIVFVCTHSDRIPAADSGAVSQMTSKAVNINLTHNLISRSVLTKCFISCRAHNCLEF